MNRSSLLCASFLLCIACGSPPTPQAAATPPPASLPELRAPLEELRTWFDAHRGEARFLAILSPT